MSTAPEHLKTNTIQRLQVKETLKSPENVTRTNPAKVKAYFNEALQFPS